MAKGQLKWGRTPYWRRAAAGKSWFGRGYGQLTHRATYQKAGDMVGLDLARDPCLAMRADIAAKILAAGSQQGIFAGKKLSDYLPDDYVGAR